VRAFGKKQGLQKSTNFEEIIMKNCILLDVTKDYKWFAACFSTQKEEGLSWKVKEDLEQLVYLGEFHEGRLNGWGIQFIRSLEKNSIFNKQRYVIGFGIWTKGMQNGLGICVTRELTYFGEFKNGEAHGKGKITYKNGFQYEGEWVQDQPQDPEACLHPKIRECIQKKICTRIATGNSNANGQFLLRCFVCSLEVCEPCAIVCHEHTRTYKRWCDDSYEHNCYCNCTISCKANGIDKLQLFNP